MRNLRLDRFEEQRLEEFPGSFADFTREQIEGSIVQRFEAIARRYPTNIALSAAGQRWTYDALNRSANRIAHAILAHSGPGEGPVPLFLGHSSDTVVAIIGVLKARRAYCVVDPAHPRTRLHQILQELQPDLVLTDTGNAGLAQELVGSDCPLILTDGIGDGLSFENPDLSLVSVLTAIFYTSGSSGRPKGVQHNQRTILHRIWLDTNEYRISAGERISSLFSMSFSASVAETFGALLNGACLCMYDVKAEGLDALADWLRREQVTLFHIPIAALRQFLDLISPIDTFPAIRHLVPSGQIFRTDLDRFWKHFPNSTLISHMGASETSAVARMVVTPETEFTGNVVPLGYVVEDKEVLILDDTGAPLPPGQIGEIAVRSRYLSAGYWQRPDLSARAFLADPEGADRRIYRMGDLGRLSAKGRLEHLGRRDTQIKIRGYRVEISEVEAALYQQKIIKEAAVVARESEPGEKKLVAYVVLRSRLKPTASDDLRSVLCAALPDYMVPASFVFVETLPRTDNGKLDINKLPDPGRERPSLSIPYAAPRDALERDLVQMCEIILGVHPIGTRDDLFDLGADSLTAVRLISRIEKAFHKHIPPGTLFRAPTLEQLAAAIRQGTEPEIWPSLIPLQPRGSRLPFFWIHGDMSNVYLPKYLGPDQPLYGLDHQSQEGRPAVYTEVQTIAAYYLREVFTVQPKGPYFLGGYSFGGIVAFEMAQQLKSRNEEVRFLALLDPANFGRGVHASRTHAPLPMNSLRHHKHKLPLENKLDYIMARIATRIRNRVSPLRGLLQKITWKTCLGMGLRMPAFVRGPYVLNVYNKAKENYIPQPYGGQALLFHTRKRSSKWQRDWEQILQGGFQSHKLEGRHMELRQGSHVHAWAGILRDSLLHSQTDDPRQYPSGLR